MSDFVRPQRRRPTRLPHPWDSPSKNVGCHFLLQCMKVKSSSEVAQSCPTLSYPMDCSLPGSSAHRIFQARVLQWGAIAFSRFTSREAGIPRPRVAKTLLARPKTLHQEGTPHSCLTLSLNYTLNRDRVKLLSCWSSP